MSASKIFSGYKDHFLAEARLAILKTLDLEPSKRLNDKLIAVALEAHGISRPREFVMTQLSWLQDQGGAVELHEIGTVVVAELTQAGDDHLRRRMSITGVAAPSLPR